jgi:molecular chaperone GrpE (heat shock protein)
MSVFPDAEEAPEPPAEVEGSAPATEFEVALEPEPEQGLREPAPAGDPQTDLGPSAESQVVQATAPQTDLAELVQKTGDNIIAAFRAQAETDRFRETQVERLHQELQTYRADPFAKALQPILSAVIRLHGEAARTATELRGRSAAELSPERLLRLFDEFCEDLEHILQGSGVDVFVDQESGELFNPRRQQVVGRDPTSEPGQHARISNRVRPGFEFGGALLKKEAVRIFAYDAAPPPAGSLPPDTTTAPPVDGGDAEQGTL